MRMSLSDAATGGNSSENHVGRRILLLEDHDDTARAMRRLLELQGFSIVVTPTLAAAKSLIENSDELPDLMILDIAVPDGDGRHLLSAFPPDTDWGPYRPWAQPWLLLTQNAGHPPGPGEARGALRRCPPPPPGLLTEALWALIARAAVALGDRDKAQEACAALQPAAGEIAGAASGLLTAGPVHDYLAEAAPLLR